jgi:endonuclease G
MDKRKLLDQLVRERFEETKSERAHTRMEVFRGVPLRAELDTFRASRYAYRHHAGAEALQGDSVDFLPSRFLEIGAACARSVALVRAGGVAQGTGFLISPRLFITNNHVLDAMSQAVHFTVEFNYEVDSDERLEQSTVFTLDPDTFWLTNEVDNLDFTIVALGARRDGNLNLGDLGFLPLSDRPDKHALGMCVNIIQHPLGRRKQIVVRENRLLARGGDEGNIAKRALHYSADTEEGASGSPVFNDDWDVVALHHWGVPHLDTVTINGESVPQTVNEGVRASVIVAQLKADLATLDEPQRKLLAEALTLGETGGELLKPISGLRSSLQATLSNTTASATSKPWETAMNTSGDIVQVVNVPLEIRVRIGDATRSAIVDTSPVALRGPSFLEGYAEKLKVDRNYSNRNGYNPKFIDGLEIRLTDIVAPRIAEVAPLKDGSGGAAAALDYQNFSIVMSADRRLALLTATNIDADSYVPIDRDTGLPRVGPEGESWYDDERIEREFFVPQSFYSDWSTYFDRGHLTRRTDPTWGSETEAVRANADTYHRTNCSPQHFRFNQSVKYWQGVERYILEWGVLKSKRRVTVLTGPLLDNNWKEYGDLKVPMQYWKVVLRVGKDAKPQASALLVNQESLLKEKRVPLKPGGDGSQPDVAEFRVSVAFLEVQTGLDFSSFRAYDTYKKPGAEGGAEAAPTNPISDWSDLL